MSAALQEAPSSQSTIRAGCRFSHPRRWHAADDRSRLAYASRAIKDAVIARDREKVQAAVIGGGA